MLWGGGHIGSSRMEQSYCTSGFFRQRVDARNYSNYQPTPKPRSIIAYGKRENARRDKCVTVCVICFIFFSCSVLSWIHTNNASIFSSLSRMRVFIFWPNKLKCACEKVKCACDKVIKNTCVRVWIQLYTFQTFPGKAQLFPPFFFLHFKCCDWHVWSLKVSGASEGMNSVYCFFLSVDNLILIILNGICVHKIDVLDSFYSAYDRPTLIFENHIIFKVHFSSNFIWVKSSKLPSKKVKQFSNKFKHRPPLMPFL